MRDFRLAAGTTTVLLAAALVRALAIARDLGVSTGSARWMLLFALHGLALLGAAGFFAWSGFPSGRRAAARLAGWRTRIDFPPFAAVVLCGLCAVVFPIVVLAPLPDAFGPLLETLAWRAVVFWLSALAGTAALAAGFPGKKFDGLLLGVILAFAVVHQGAVFIPDISTNPFSLGWSEASRYYYASLFAAERVYGVDVPWSVLHPTRYWLQAAPFLVNGLPLWFHRLWQVALWLGLNGAAAWLLARRPGLRLATGFQRVLLAGWAFLFLFQGPVWYHLVAMAGFLYWGVDSASFRRTLAVVVAGSLWAGVSRVNWIPFPAALAALVYLVEVPQGERSLIRYLAPVFAWGLAGAAAGFAAQAAYVALSGNPAEQFGSAFTSDLLWYRLFPNATYPLGVLPGILLATLPVAAAVWWVVRSGRVGITTLRWIGISAILGVFFGGGLVVSAKIGGGSNLHNLDGYLALLLAAAVLLVFGTGERQAGLPRSILALAVLVPVGFAVASGGPVPADDPADLEAELAELERLVEGAAAGGGAVLFIAERHLLTFDLVDDVELVPEYEKVFLMEMAMGGNETYLDRFESDLAAGRFALIVSDLVRFNIQGREDDFGEENNAWDRYVTYPLLCYYEEIQTLETAGVEILVPKESPACPEIPVE